MRLARTKLQPPEMGSERPTQRAGGRIPNDDASAENGAGAAADGRTLKAAARVTGTKAHPRTRPAPRARPAGDRDAPLGNGSRAQITAMR